MNKLQLFLLSLALAGWAVAAPAQNAGDSIGEHFFPALGRVLTNNQRESLRQTMVSQRARLQPLVEQLRSSRQALLNQITGGDFNETLVRQYAEQSARAESQLTVILARALAHLQPPLSPQQVKQLKSFPAVRFREVPETGGSEPELHLKLPPPLPRDTNDLPIVQ